MKKDIIHVAVTDDQLLFRECFIATINSFATIKVIMEASNGMELIEKLKNADVKPDVLLVDLDMPVLNGVETVIQLHKLYNDVKIIILSIHDEEKYIARMVQLGINGYLAKNAGLSEVERAITNVHTKGYYFNDDILKLIQSGMLNKNLSKKAKSVNELSSRELDILVLICEEQTTADIAKKLHIAERTVEWHRNNLLTKTDSRNTAGLVMYAVKNKLLGILE